MTVNPMPFKVWIDTSINYLARKSIDLTQSERSRGESEVLSFREVKPGIFFPVKVERRAYQEGRQTILMTTNVITISINDPIDPAVFSLRFPAGTRVFDKARGITYVVKGDEELDPSIPTSPILQHEQVEVKYATGQGPPEQTPWRKIVGWSLVSAATLFVIAFLYLRHKSAV